MMVHKLTLTSEHLLEAGRGHCIEGHAARRALQVVDVVRLQQGVYSKSVQFDFHANRPELKSDMNM